MFNITRARFLYNGVINRIQNAYGHPVVIKALEPMSPALHLSVEKWLFDKNNVPVMFLRTNPTPGCIVIGTNQLAQAECNLKKIKEDNVEIIRRSTGGGAVYVDGGNCMVGILGPDDTVNKDVCHSVMTTAISNCFNVDAKFTGKNDIKVDEFKVAGLAYSQRSSKFLAHACILVNANLSALPKYLTPHQKKLDYKGIKSVDQNVKNLLNFPFNGECYNTREDLEDHLEESFFFKYPKFTQFIRQRISVTNDEMLSIPEILETYNTLKDPENIFKKKFSYNVDIAEKFDWGFVRLFLHVESTADGNVITNVEISSDAVDTKQLDKIKHTLKNISIDDFIKYYKNHFNADTIILRDVYKLIYDDIIS